MTEDEAREELEKTLKKIVELGDRFPALSDQFSKFITGVKKNTDDFSKAITELNKGIAKGRKGYQDQLKVIEDLGDAIEELAETVVDGADEVEKARNAEAKNLKMREMISQREKVVREAALQNFNEQFEKAAEHITKSAVTAGSSLIKDMQSNAGATKLSATMLTAGIDMASQAAQGMGSAVASASSALMTIPHPAAQVAGVLGIVAGNVLESGAKLAAGLAKFGVEVMSAEVEKTTKAFGDISNAGALFADGMTGMRTAAKSSMLTLQEFAAVVGRQSANLAATGLSVPVATKRLGDALARGGDTMRKNLMNLGYRIEEHGDLVGETMAQMAQQSGPLRATNAEVAAATEAYATNLREIAAITGQDAKKKAEQVRQEASQLMFQQKLADLDATTRSNVMNAMSRMSDVERKNFMDMVNFGTVINRQGNIAMAATPELQKKQDAMMDLFNKRQLDAESMYNLEVQHNDKIREQSLKGEMAQGLAASQAAGAAGVVADAAETLGKNLQQTATGEAVVAARNAAKDQKATTDETTDSLHRAQIAAQNLAISFEDITTKLLPEYSKLTAQILESFREHLRSLGIAVETDEDRAKKAKAADEYETARAEESELYKKEGAGAFAQMTGIGLSDEAKAARKRRIEAQKAREKVDGDFAAEEGATPGTPSMTSGMKRGARGRPPGAGSAGTSGATSGTASTGTTGQATSPGTPAAAGAPAAQTTGPTAEQEGQRRAGATSISPAAIDLIKSFEGFRAKAHWDNKQYSIGYGTRTDDPDEQAGRKTITEQEATARLATFVRNIEPDIIKYAKMKGWGQPQVDAMASFAYNLGPGNLKSLTADGKRTNKEIAETIIKYSKAGGKESKGLMNRRLAEQALFMQDMPMMAKGGITKGLSIAGEAGPEAVVPLPDGKNIPIQFEPKVLEAFRVFADMYSMSSMGATSDAQKGSTAFSTDAQTTETIQKIFAEIMPVITEQFASGKLSPEEWQRSLGIESIKEVSKKAAQMTESIQGFAEGGIANGPDSGYLANLHGTEAVVPLSNNKSIPVQVDNSGLETVLQNQSKILTSILRVMEKNNNIASGILQANY